jgi:hypothetical protein
MMRTSRVLLSLSLLAASACVNASLEPTASTEQWRYEGEQRLPAALRLEGGLQLTPVSSARFEGLLDVRRTDPVGQVQRVAGLVIGRRSPDAMEFEATLDGSVVRHIGRVSGDSISGTWFNDSGLDASFTSGAFVLVRQR